MKGCESYVAGYTCCLNAACSGPPLEGCSNCGYRSCRRCASQNSLAAALALDSSLDAVFSDLNGRRAPGKHLCSLVSPRTKSEQSGQICNGSLSLSSLLSFSFSFSVSLSFFLMRLNGMVLGQ